MWLQSQRERADDAAFQTPSRRRQGLPSRAELAKALYRRRPRNQVPSESKLAKVSPRPQQARWKGQRLSHQSDNPRQERNRSEQAKWGSIHRRAK